MVAHYGKTRAQTSPLKLIVHPKPIAMEAEKMLQADLLDLIFENRNKAYGAYALRKNYDYRLYGSMGIVFLILSLLYLLIPGVDSLKIQADKIFEEVTTTQVMLEPPKQQQPLQQPKPKPAQQAAAPQKNNMVTSSIQIVDSSQFDKTKIPAADSTGTTRVGIGNVTYDGPGQQKPGTDSGRIKKPGVGDDDNRNAILETAEVMPSFPGGMQALHRFLQQHLQNPSDMEPGDRIAVKIKFIVGYDGKLKNLEVVQDGGTVFNNEVIRVIKKMPTWIPGKSKGEHVSVYHVIPVIFIGQEQ